MLSNAHRVRLTDHWSEADAPLGEDLMLALHARRSADSVDAWRRARPGAALLLALTGTDLYRDIELDAAAQRSLAAADALVVLNAYGARRLPTALQSKCHVVLQSCAARSSAPKSDAQLRAVLVGHLREEKDPRCAFRAAQRLAHRGDIAIDHIGSALDAGLGREAAATAATLPNYRWLGGLPHEETLAHIGAAHVLIHPSRIEGGAHVVVEAIRAGTPVIASRIDGNLGLLGADHDAVFDVGDDAALARLVERARDEPAWLQALRDRLATRAPLFSPEAESAALHQLVDALLAGRNPSLSGRSR